MRGNTRLLANFTPFEGSLASASVSFGRLSIVTNLASLADEHGLDIPGDHTRRLSTMMSQSAQPCMVDA